MATILGVCPYCRAGGVKAPASAVGSSATCPKCGSSFTLMPSDGVPGWAAKSPTAETRPTAALPDVTEPSPVLPADPSPEPKAKRKKKKAEPAPVEPAAPEPPEPEEVTDFGLVLALGALSLVGAAVLATLFPYGRYVAAGLAGLGLLGGLAALAAEGRARLVGAGAAGLHFLILMVVLLLPSWFNLDPWRQAADNSPKGPQAVSHADQSMSPAEWVNPAVASWQCNDVRVIIGTPVVGPIELRGPKDAKRATKERYLQFSVRVTNAGVTRKIDLSGWAVGQAAETLRVTEAAGKELKPAIFDGPWQPEPAKPTVPHLFPGKSSEVTFLFAAPPAKTDAVRIQLPGAAAGLPEETIKFHLNSSYFAPLAR